jgi:hypothetical protein
MHHRSVGFEAGVKVALGRSDDAIIRRAKARAAVAKAALAKKKELDDAIAAATAALEAVASGPAAGAATRKKSTATGPEVDAFRAALAKNEVDPEYPDEQAGHAAKGAAAVVRALEKTGLLKIERFKGALTLESITAKAGSDGVVVRDELCAPGAPEVVAIQRPLVLLEEELIQPALVRKGLRIFDPEVVTLDRLLADVELRLSSYLEGPGKPLESMIDERAQTVLPRTIKRITEVREPMHEEVKKSKGKKSPLPTKTSLRDLLMFIVDQVHRFDDALALLPDKAFRASWAETVFKDVVFRTCAPYLSQTQGISIDTAVVAGADIGTLAGRYKKETEKPKPKRESNLIFSVVIPCYVQAGTCIRPALVRVGDYS